MRSPGSKTTPVADTTASPEAQPPAAWLRAIIQAVGDRALTLDEIQRAVGEIIVTPETAAIEEYVEVLLQEDVLVDSHGNQHFELTESGRTLLEGVLTTPSSSS